MQCGRIVSLLEMDDKYICSINQTNDAESDAALATNEQINFSRSHFILVSHLWILVGHWSWISVTGRKLVEF